MAGPVEVTTKKVTPSGIYSAAGISLFGVPFDNSPVVVDSPVFLGSGTVGIGIGCLITPLGRNNWLPALIFGYSYQGHFYNLPEPVVMIVYSPQWPPEPAGGQGGYGPGYYVWHADKLDRTARVTFTNDTFEELILKSNIGESRQPIAYHAAMAMSHRGGKLMD
jgi:hypothetical protein